MDNFLIKTIKDATDEELSFMMDKYKEKQNKFIKIRDEIINSGVEYSKDELKYNKMI